MHFHPEEANYQMSLYEIGANGQPYMISGPQYAIGHSGYVIGQDAAGQPMLALAPQQNAMSLARAPWLAQLGNLAQSMPNLSPMPHSPVAVMQMPRPTIVTKQDPTEARLEPLGCNFLALIGVGVVVPATVAPQKTYKPERFVVPPSVAPDFLIQSIFIGVYLQSPATGAISAESFLPDAIYTNVDFTTCQISQSITVNAQNTGGAPRNFLSTFFGRSIQ
jgi:hypothetical protein